MWRCETHVNGFMKETPTLRPRASAVVRDIWFLPFVSFHVPRSLHQALGVSVVPRPKRLLCLQQSRGIEERTSFEQHNRSFRCKSMMRWYQRMTDVNTDLPRGVVRPMPLYILDYESEKEVASCRNAGRIDEDGVLTKHRSRLKKVSHIQIYIYFSMYNV